MDATRYIVSWTPTADVERACAKLGMKPGDGTSFWDWIEPNACTKEITVERFDQAVAVSRGLLPLDCCGEVRIDRQVLVRDHDDLGNVFKGKSWEIDAMWHVQPDDEPCEDNPTYAEAA